MLRALREQNRIIAGKDLTEIKKSVNKLLVGITYDYESNYIKDHVYEYLFRGSDVFKKVKKALDEADIIYDVTQDDPRNSTKILEIDFDEN